MRVLITGGCGFLGSNLTAAILGDGGEVVVVDSLTRRGSKDNLAWLRSMAGEHQLHFHPVEVAVEPALVEVFAKHGPFDWVAHLAGQVAMTTSMADPRRDFSTNVVGSFNILETVRRHSPSALLTYSSTNKVYGDLKDRQYHETPTRYQAVGYPEGFDESLPLDFASPYGCSKGAADQYFRDWFRNYGLKTVVFRHSSIYGGRQFPTYDQGWVGWFCLKGIEQERAVARGGVPEPFTISGTGKQVRDVLNAEDLVSLYLAAYRNGDRVAGEIFNIGGGRANSLSLLELFDLLSRELDLPDGLSFTKQPRRQSDQDYFVADVTKTERLLGFRPRVSSEAGVRMMVNWIRSVEDGGT